jgi:hypothetical protein
MFNEYEDEFIAWFESRHGTPPDHYETTVKCIVKDGPYAGPFIVSITCYKAPSNWGEPCFKSAYFWNGRRVKRRDLHFLGAEITERWYRPTFDALKQGSQVDNSTVPMETVDLISGAVRSYALTPEEVAENEVDMARFRSGRVLVSELHLLEDNALFEAFEKGLK